MQNCRPTDTRTKVGFFGVIVGHLAIPFGPYLAVAGWLTLLFKAEIITTYLDYVL